MTPVIAFGVTFAAYGGAALCALVGDALRIGRASSLLAALALIAGGAVSLSAGWSLPAATVFGSFLVGGAYSGVLGLAGVLAGLSVLAGASQEGVGAPVGQQSALVALSVVGAGVAAVAADLVTLVIALEIAAACGYALVAASRTRGSAEAAMKYFVQGAMITGLLVAGVAVLVGGYSPGGSHLELAGAVTSGRPVDPAILLGLTLVAASLVFKAGGAPFHSWVPDAYEQAPESAAAVLSGPVKLAMITALSTVMFVVGGAGTTQSAPLGVVGTRLVPLVGALAVASVVAGSLAAIRQRSYTRMLAYAGVAQVGYALIAVASRNHSAAVFFACTYSISSAGAFLGSRAVRGCSPEWDGSIEGLRGLSRRRPSLGLSMTVLMFSLAGIPPLLGFWGKLQAFQSAVAAGLVQQEMGRVGLAGMYAVLVVAGIVGSIISVAYYGSVVRAMYAEPATDTPDSVPADALTEFAVAASAAAVLLLGVAPLMVPFGQVFRGFLP